MGLLDKYLAIKRKKRKTNIKEINIGDEIYEVCSDGEFIDSNSSAIITFYKGASFADALILRKKEKEAKKNGQ